MNETLMIILFCLIIGIISFLIYLSWRMNSKVNKIYLEMKSIESIINDMKYMKMEIEKIEKDCVNKNLFTNTMNSMLFQLSNINKKLEILLDRRYEIK